MGSYKGHICNQYCEWKFPLNCWACKKPWCLECIKEDRPELISWIENQIMVPRANAYFVEGACLQFICPSCIYDKMENTENELTEGKGLMNRLSNEMSQIRAELAGALLKNDGKIEMLAKMYNESTSFMAARMDKINELIEDSKNHTISELAAHFSKNDVASWVTNNGKPNKRPRLDDNPIDMTDLLDLSMNFSLTDGRHGNQNMDQDTAQTSLPVPVQTNSANSAILANGAGTMNGAELTTQTEPVDISMPSELQTVNASIKSSEKHKHEIFASKFHPDESEERIMQHLTQKLPGLDRGEIRVRKLVSSKMAGNVRQYVSFRISTNNENVYKELLNPRNWPNATARPYMKNKTKGKNTKLERNSRPGKRGERVWNAGRRPEPQVQKHSAVQRPMEMYQPIERYQNVQQQYQMPHFTAVYPHWYGNNTGNRPFLYPQMNSAFQPMN